MTDKKTPPVETTDEATAEMYNTSSTLETQQLSDASIDLERLRFEAAAKDAAAHIPPQWLERLSYDPKIRQRAWWFLLYPESMNPRTLEILSASGVRGCISPLHDKDVWPDGTPKKAHFHCIVYDDGKTSAAALERLVRTVNGVRLEPCINVVGAVRYLAHLDINPDKIPGDVGKHRYDPDEIVSFNGFDAQQHLKATTSQVAKALGELYALVREREIISYDDFIDLIYLEKREYTFVMANQHVCSQIRSYICSRYAKTKAAYDARQAAQFVKDAHEDLALAANRMSEMEEVVSTFIGLLTPAFDAYVEGIKADIIAAHEKDKEGRDGNC